MLWRHPILQYTKDVITSPLSSLGSEVLQSEAIKLFKCSHLFMTVQVNQLGIDYHVVLAQNALQQCLDMPELVDEFVCALVKQTTRLTGQKTGVQVNKKLGKQTKVSAAQQVEREAGNFGVFEIVTRKSFLVSFWCGFWFCGF